MGFGLYQHQDDWRRWGQVENTQSSTRKSVPEQRAEELWWAHEWKNPNLVHCNASLERFPTADGRGGFWELGHTPWSTKQIWRSYITGSFCDQNHSSFATWKAPEYISHPNTFEKAALVSTSNPQGKRVLNAYISSLSLVRMWTWSDSGQEKPNHPREFFRECLLFSWRLLSQYLYHAAHAWGDCFMCVQMKASLLKHF